MPIRGLAQVHVSAQDLDGAISFYRDRIGLPLVMSFPDQSMAFFEVGSVRLYVAKPESPEFESHPILYFDTDDIEEEFERLVGKGAVPIERPHQIYAQDDTQFWLAFFEGFEGHPFALMEERYVP